MIVFLALLGLAGASERVEGLVAHVTAVEARPDGPYAWVDRGSRDGVRQTELPGQYIRAPDDENNAVNIGEVRVAEVRGGRTLVRVSLLEGAGDARVGDLVTVIAGWEEPAAAPRVAGLAANGIVFTDARGKPLYAWRDVARSPELRDLDVCAAAAVGTEASAEEACAVFGVVESMLPAFLGLEVSFRQLYANWLEAGRPLAPLDVAERALALPAAERADWLGSVTWTGELPERWYLEVERRADAGDLEGARDLAALFLLFAEGADDARAWDLAASAQALALQASGDVPGAIAAWELAVAHAMSPRSRAASESAIGTLYQNAGDYESAIVHYRAALAAEGDAPRGFAERDLGQALNYVGRDEEAVAAFRAAIPHLEAVGNGDALDAAAQCWNEMGASLAALGRRNEAFAAWDQGLAMSRRLDLPNREGQALRMIADEVWDLDYAKARALMEEAAAAFARAGLPEREAICWVDVGMLASDLGDDAAAVVAVQRGIDLARVAGDVLALSDALIRMSILQREVGDVTGAMGLLDEARALLEGAGDLGQLAHVWMRIGEARASQQQWPEAEAAFAQAMAYAEQTDDMGLQGRTAYIWGDRVLRAGGGKPEVRLARAAELYRAAGRIPELVDALVSLSEATPSGPESEAYAREAGELARGLRDAGLEARARIALAFNLFEAGDLDGAEREFLAAREVRLGANDLHSVAAVDAWLARVSMARGDAAAARRWAEQAVEHGVASGATSHAAAAWNLIALLDLREDDPAGTIAAATRARELAVEVSDRLNERQAYDLLARAQWMRGALPQAASAARRSVEMNREQGHPEELAGALSLAASIAVRRGRPDLGRGLAEEGLALAPSPWSEALLHAALAEVEWVEGHLDAAAARLDRAEAVVEGEEASRKALRPLLLGLRGELLLEAGADGRAALELALAEAAPESSEVAQLQGLLGREAWMSGRFEEADRLLTASDARLAALDHQSGRWRGQFDLFRARRDRGHVEEAVAPGLEAVRLLDDLVSMADGPEGVRHLVDLHGEVWEEVAALLQASGREAEAWSVAQARRAHELDAVAVVAGSAEEQAAADDMATLDARRGEVAASLAREKALPAAEQRPDRLARLEAELSDLDLRFRDFSRELESKYPDLLARLHVAPPDLAALQADLGPDEAFLEPVVLPDRVVLFVVRSTGVTHREVQVPEAEVSALVGAMRAMLSRPAVPWQTRGVKIIATQTGEGSGSDPTAAARALYDLLIAPIAADLEGVTTLLVSPSGRLRYVPFAALYDGERFLVERYRVALLTQSGTRGEHRPVSRDARILALANPDGTLPGATAEVAALKKVWGRRRVQTLVGGEATEEGLRQGLAGVQILHLATHGVLLDDAPRDSYLVLAGEGDAARLTLREITLLPAGELELVVLSACETAVGEAGEGAAIAGLAYQFEVRDAAAVVASLWAVSDDSTSAMMVTLYEALRQEGMSRAEALRQAQLALLADERWRHPYYWAPFLLIGDWR